MKIALIDDQHLFRNVLAHALSARKMEVIFQMDDGMNFIDYLDAGKPAPDIAIVDMAMPIINGMELTKMLQERHPSIKVIVLSVNYRNSLISKLIDLGASAYLNKNCDLNTLLQAINSVYQTGFYMDATTLKALKDRHQRQTVLHERGFPVDLTKREKEVLQYICEEYNNQGIADKLFISLRTVEGHRNSLLVKTGCRNTAGLVIFAIKHRLFEVLS